MSVVKQTRRIVVCADDFGANDAASNAIIDLGQRQAISATSCLVHAPAAATHASRLRVAAPAVSIGLHLDLTQFVPGSIRATLHRWLLRGLVLRNADRAQVLAEIRRQLQRFEELFARPPAYVDGHCHVHQLPGVREPLLREIAARYGRSVAIRSTCVAGRRGLKAWIIQELGGRAMRRQIARAELHANTDFAGVYDFSRSQPFERRMEYWLRRLHDGGMLMCHPEMPVAAAEPGCAREDEYRFLASPAWSEMRARHGILLEPFRGS